MKKELLYRYFFVCFAVVVFGGAVMFSSCASTPDISNDVAKAPESGSGSGHRAGKDVPQWVYSSKVVYPETDYLTYVGYGPDRNTAEIAALSGLSAIFGQDISVNTNSSNRMTEAAADGKVAITQNRDFSQEVQKKVNIDNLVGVEIEEYWFDGNSTWYAVAVLNKDKACELYRNMILKNAGAINDLVLSAKEDLYTLESLCAIDFAQEIAVENKKNLDKLYLINYGFAESLKRNVVSPEELGKKKLEIAKKIPVSIYIEGDEDGNYTSAFFDALADFGFSASVDSDVRYVIDGVVSYNFEKTSDGKTAKCYYDFETSFVDTEKGINIFPIIIRGRQAHRSVGEARNRAKLEIIKKINSTFNKEFKDYLGSYMGSND